MERGADDLPPPYLGDPHGLHWAAYRQDGSVEDNAEAEDFTVEGTRLRIMWDEGAGPLWGDGGLLPDDPAWLRQALGLSDSLIPDLRDWVHDMDTAHAHGQSPASLNVRAQQLTERLQTEVGSQFRVRLHHQ
jgi:hypothetical protein